MAARPLQPSEYEIQREVEALKDLRRRSTNPGALTLDPDLPIPSGPGSPTSPYRQFNTSSSSQDDDNHDASAHPGGVSLVNVEAQGSSAQDEDDSPTDDPFHLFWVPASKHPELAPGEFRAFLKEHARVPSNDEGANLARSMSSSSLSRKKSMLSRPYKPRENDGVEDESIVPIKRNRSVYRHDGPQLTISDLQKLDELAEEASQSDDPSKLRSVLRRSLSMNLSPTGPFLIKYKAFISQTFLLQQYFWTNYLIWVMKLTLLSSFPHAIKRCEGRREQRLGNRASLEMVVVIVSQLREEGKHPSCLSNPGHQVIYPAVITEN